MLQIAGQSSTVHSDMQGTWFLIVFSVLFNVLHSEGAPVKFWGAILQLMVFKQNEKLSLNCEKLKLKNNQEKKNG